MKKLFLMLATVAMLTACNGNGNASGSNASNESSAQATEQNDQANMQEVTKGPGTVECEKFSVDLPDGWEVNNKQDKVISVKAPSGEIFEFVYEEQSNYTQEKQFKMEKDGVQDKGEKAFGDNTYASYVWMDAYSAVMKIGDGNAGTIKVNTTNVKDDTNEMIAVILPNVKMK